MPQDAAQLIAALARDRVVLDLKTLDLCFLAGLYLRAGKASLPSFEEDVLIDLFEQVCDVVEPGTERPRKRATHAIQRLRDQRMLARVDGAGIVRSGEYTLTRLAAEVIGCFLDDETLTRESLSLLTGTLQGQLSEIRSAARRADSPTAWREEVVASLRVTVGDLVGGIERRQRGLDSQQEEVQAEIATLLQADWFGAVERCQTLLDTTTSTLQELNQVLLHDTNQFHTMLQEIHVFACEAEQPEAEEAVQRVIDQVDRIRAWGSARQRGWSDYYQYVHRYLRDVVRLDPDRALSQRLRDQVSTWPSAPFHLLLAAASPMRLLRPLESRLERPAVMRARTNREGAPEFVEPEGAELSVEALVEGALAAGARSLAEVTERVLPAFPGDRRYAVTGRVADALVRITRTRSARERPWRSVAPGLEVEDWALSAEEGRG
jgi:chromosome partition protein MukF